jgi:hypothetical protein
MKKSEKRKRVLGTLLTRWVTITFMGLLVVTGIFQFDKYQATKVIGPLVDLFFYSNDITYYKELEATNNGYIDTTKFSDRIEELTQERRDKYYNSSDKAISYVTSQNALVKLFFGLMSVILVGIVTLFPLLILWGLYSETYKSFIKHWRRINEVDVKKFERNKNYREFAQSIRNQ